MQWRTSVCVVGMLAIPVVVRAQTTTNPDISVLPRFKLESSDAGRRGLPSPSFTLDELELGLQAYVNPYARGDVFLSKEGTGASPFEVEEAYVTFLRGLPGDLNIRLGKYRAEFGKLNSVHPHAWPFISMPSSLERFLGKDGLNDLGINVSTLLPTGDVYTRLSVDALRGNATGVIDPRSSAPDGGPGLADTLGRSPDWAFSGRLMSFFPVSETSDLEIGLSALNGVHDPYRSLRFTYASVDFKYKWKPDLYTSLTIQGEGLANVRTVAPDSRLTSAGGYVYADYQFLRSYSIGVRVDASESPYRSVDRTRGAAIFAGFYPVEETAAFRLEYRRAEDTSPGIPDKRASTVALQVMFSLGPHKAHPF